MVNIKVAVRIRPLSEREQLHGEEIIVRKEDKSVLVTNPKIPERQDGDSRQRTRRFAVDFCYDSGDPEGGSQEAVYKGIGSEVLRWMHEGYNACVLAYGHSASGKTYTVMGLRDDPGLTPRLCEGLFDAAEGKRPEGRLRVRVVVSFLEIYNEKVRDLLGGEETGATCGNFSLRVREHPKLGPYVQGLSEHSVADKTKLLQLLSTGNGRRSTAATESNALSSRSHAVFTIRFEQSDEANRETDRSSKVHLVDLAGSERARSSQSKARLQEGANINKSLATLGNVISALAEGRQHSGLPSKEHSESSKSWQPFVPYRDSVLTWLLKDTLGGNSNTIMIATVSPAGSCIGETVNTLRYAKRAKKIVNRPTVNEDPKVRAIRELREEVARLRSLLVLFRSCGGEVDPLESGEESGKAAAFPRRECERPEPGGEEITIKEGSRNKEDSRGERRTDQDGEVKEDSREEEEEEEKAVAEAAAAKREREAGVSTTGASFSGGAACEIDDEKKSDVNGSVNDNFSHETQFFSDSLESFSSVFPKSLNSWDADGSGGPGKPDASDEDDDGAEARAPGGRILDPNQRRWFDSRDEPWRKAFPEMLHRSRPDLIKGISTRAGDNGLPPGSSHSCTDVSNLSQSTSENSLNSSGSAEAQLAEGRSPQNPGAGRSGAGNGAPEATSRKKEKRMEIVEAVTSRLYATKKKPDRRAEALKKEEGNDDGGDPEEPKLCKRARMKLFDLSRKLAMSRKMKKTVDSDTQTECSTGTVRVKEKCVTTDSTGVAGFESAASDDGAREEKKPYVIMNQVFIPAASKCVVECGEVVRVEGPEVHESATQTPSAGERRKSAEASPVAFGPREEDRFSEDSLDSEGKSASRRENFHGRDRAGGAGGGDDDDYDVEGRPRFARPPASEVRGRRGFEKRAKGQILTKSEGERGASFEGLPSFARERTDEVSRVGFFVGADVFESKITETGSESECSSTSTEGADSNSLSETSSEDFVFYENPKDSPTKGKAGGDRELYTITENSEQSDPGDACSPVRRRRPPSGAGEERRTARRPGTESETRKEPKAFDGGKERSETPPSFGKGGADARIPSEHREPVTVFEFAGGPKGSPFSASSARDGFARNADLQPNDATFRAGLEERGKNPTDLRIDVSEKQFLNLNISGGGSGGRAPPFSVDTHLFGKASKKDQSAEAASASADSITFVFMGPAKPKTSVLMEIIGRSLGRGPTSGEAPRGQRRARSRGVQCDAGLTRSVSVDTAMIALSRIARNQETSPEMQRTTSLGELDSDETPVLSGRGNLRREPGSGCRCEFEAETKGCASRDSAGGSAVCGKSKKAEAERPKKTVSWFEEAEAKRRGRGSGEPSEGPSFESERRDFPDGHKWGVPKLSPASAEADFCERRVRFLKPEISGFVQEGRGRGVTERADDLSAFLKEATQLLKSINSRSSTQRVFSEEGIEEFGAEASGTKDENRKGGSRGPKRAEGMPRSRTEARPEKAPGWRPKTGSEGEKLDENRANLTWPRRRAAATAGKPPTGTKPRFPRSPLPSRFDSLRSGCFPNPRTWSRTARPGSEEQARNPSSLSVALGETESGSLFSGRLRRGEVAGRGDLRSPQVSPPPRTNDPTSDFGSVSDLETDLEECCRRLEMVTEQDEIREKIGERKKKAFEHRAGLSPGAGAENRHEVRERQGGRKKPREATKRRKTECAGGCVCEASGREPCRRLWSRGCRSSFELDSFGPGSSHCHQLCMFCRKKEAETYHSAVSLNSECSSGLCRLNYYGFCPCSPVKLSQVVSSPRAYMQRLLALRKRIVSETKRDPEGAGRWDVPGSSRGGLPAAPRLS